MTSKAEHDEGFPADDGEESLVELCENNLQDPARFRCDRRYWSSSTTYGGHDAVLNHLLGYSRKDWQRATPPLCYLRMSLGPPLITAKSASKIFSISTGRAVKQ